MTAVSAASHWLDQYASNEYRWQRVANNVQTTTYYRPLGLVELAFDADGRYYEGRADITTLLELATIPDVDRRQLRERIGLAWTALRYQHALLQARAVSLASITGDGPASATNVGFAIDVRRTLDEARAEATKHLLFLGEFYDSVDVSDFRSHCMNSSRLIDPSENLAKLFVFPSQTPENGHGMLRVLLVASHQILDGLSSYVWMRDLIHLLNLDESQLQHRVLSLMEPTGFQDRLPLPQEALYPPIAGSAARRRWFWLLTRILRHVRKSLPAGFENPLRRKAPRESVPHSPIYASVLDYSRTPPLNTESGRVSITTQNTQRLHRLCRETKASIGAGCFALVAVVMMELHELRFPDIPLSERRPFITGFPLNPRAFFNHHTEPNSLMLAFSDGIALPFLPSHLDLDGRIRLLARQAHRQLAAYQKRARPAGDDAKQYMSSRGAGRILANQYLSSIERSDALLPPHLRRGVNPQGAYPMRANHSVQTNGISSIGRADAVLKQGMYDLDDESRDFVADFRSITSNVRARDGEFLVGIGGSDVGLWANASIDTCAMDPQLVEQWKMRLEHVLDSPGAEKARL